MDRRGFVRSAGILGAGSVLSRGFWGLPIRLLAAEPAAEAEDPNWVDPQLGASVKASSYVQDPPWGYLPSNIFGKNVYIGWQAHQQTTGAWLEVDFPENRFVSELWILPQPLPRDILGQAPYLLTYSRTSLYATPRKVRCSLSGGQDVEAELRQAGLLQIAAFPVRQKTASLRIQVEGVWARPGTSETGIGKLLAFPLAHQRAFEIDAYAMYDVRDGSAVQAATVQLINPDEEVAGAALIVSRNGATLMRVPLAAILGKAVTRQDIWIPAPFEDTVMGFSIVAGNTAFGSSRSLRVPAYHSYFDGGTFSLNCTCHNDLGWLNTQEKTADYRSAEIILPAINLLGEYPEFRYSMECTAYLMEFLKRHPEKRQAMNRLMKSRRFTWGASYVECQEVHVGPEKLVRQFYFGRRWLKKSFPGVDTHFYVKTDPPSMTLQMPQILAKAGVKYHIQGRMPYGFYRWEAPDGSFVLTYAYHYVDPMRLLDPKGDHGWLSYAGERENYYAPHHLPRMFIYDYTSDYLPPQPALPPYVREQNEAMQRFSGVWNERNSSQQIHPPVMNFVTPEGFLDKFTEHPLDITTLKGDWPFSWAYYDEPSNREGLLAGRKAHNDLLAAERLFAGLSLASGLQDYPQQKFTEAWQANCWPDHGWGGNQGIITDAVYNASYEKSASLARELLSAAGSGLVNVAPASSGGQIPLVVFNPLNWERTDVVECRFQAPSGWQGFAIRDNSGKGVPCEILGKDGTSTCFDFVAEAVPSVGYRTYVLDAAPAAAPVTPLAGRSAENPFFKIVFGDGGIKSLYDKRLKWDVLRTGKFDGGEVIQFTAPGLAWEDPEIVTMENFDKASNHPFPFKTFTRGPVRITAVREAAFKHFLLREHFHLYHALSRMDIEVEMFDWDGQKDRELRVVFPINLDHARTSYEVPFGKVEMGSDELDFTLLPPDSDTAFRPDIYGGAHPLAYREAINWVDASSSRYLGNGCLSASDMTVHLFRDETDHPVSYPLLQHVLLSTRKSLAWNPDYWFTQKGTHRYRTALLAHKGDWRLRYRKAIAFNYRLKAFIGSARPEAGKERASAAAEFFGLEPSNLVLTALKKSEDDDRLVIRFYEAEGFKTQARVHFAKPIRQAWRCSLIEDDQQQMQPLTNGALQFSVKPWEIVTLKVAV